MGNVVTTQFTSGNLSTGLFPIAHLLLAGAEQHFRPWYRQCSGPRSIQLIWSMDLSENDNLSTTRDYVAPPSPWTKNHRSVKLKLGPNLLGEVHHLRLTQNTWYLFLLG